MYRSTRLLYSNPFQMWIYISKTLEAKTWDSSDYIRDNDSKYAEAQKTIKTLLLP